MKTPLAALVSCAAILLGCANRSTHPSGGNAAAPDDKVRRLFAASFAEFGATKLMVPAAWGTANYTVYVMPASVAPLIRLGTNALPTLRSFQGKGDPRETFARACSDIIEGRVLGVSQPLRDEASGIELVSYSVSEPQ